MSQNLIVQTKPKQQEQMALFSLKIASVADLFPGFSLGDFAVIHSAQSCATITSLLCVRAQCKSNLNSNVLFIDGGNTYNSALIARFASIHRLDPEQTLKRVSVQSVFTAYELTMLVMEHLEELVQRFSTKLVVISDIAGLFLDEQIPEEEARSVFNQLLFYLQSFAKEHKVIIVATYISRPDASRNFLLQKLACVKANVVIGLRSTQYERTFELEKHPQYMLGSAEFSPDSVSLVDFM